MGSLAPDQRRKVMRSIRSKDTKAEIRLRKALYHAGHRYRKNWKKLPGTPDIVLTRHKICVFCDSEFFHGKDYDIKKPVKTNSEYWTRKIQRNMERDREVTARLRAMGWTVVRFWDSEITKSLDKCVKAIEEMIFEQAVLKGGAEQEGEEGGL